MIWDAFQRPGFSLPVFRQRLSDELLELADGLGAAFFSGGRVFLRGEGFPSRQRELRALQRLEKAGLIIYQRGLQQPVLKVTPAGEEHLDPMWRPEPRWKRPWRGTWHVLVYDVPEKDRAFRNGLRYFLTRMRMGQLQRSVWVTPDDIQPAYEDLCTAAAIKPFAYLFESRLVLGQPAEELVRQAWPLERLADIQHWYCDIAQKKLEALRREAWSPEGLQTLAREELAAYRAAMAGDPLLPAALLPSDYLGQEVWRLHQKIQNDLQRTLAAAF